MEEEGRIFIKTIRGIRAGEELTYGHNLVLDERHTPALKRVHACYCGTRRCRGTLLGSKRKQQSPLVLEDPVGSGR